MLINGLTFNVGLTNPVCLRNFQERSYEPNCDFENFTVCLRWAQVFTNAFRLVIQGHVSIKMLRNESGKNGIRFIISFLFLEGAHSGKLHALLYLGFSVDDGDSKTKTLGVGRRSARSQRILRDDHGVAVIRNLLDIKITCLSKYKIMQPNYNWYV